MRARHFINNTPGAYKCSTKWSLSIPLPPPPRSLELPYSFDAFEILVQSLSFIGMQLILYFSIILIHSVFRVLAQGPGLDWTLETDALEECQTLSVQISSRTSEGSAVGVPPYYFLAFEVDGVPTTTPMDGIPSNMSWQVRHKRGSLLLLTMVDSNGSTGRISSVIYSIAGMLSRFTITRTAFLFD
ncbi:hypothetical protein PHLGIDRAFT_205058 [Phlebiopsis gigantea 11061_1 CR5-6]|uniref:Uncharacterized protein n=1 Tax=Phlebiopsis gigantea (strain 11061_1 CR5-6) TaxID=745531 RepID=A0A0C3NHA5_PHLG1|nr:hypothetical protein PHLGIDRAFT_205058 [Phlebiopsis gigantea 11061_1 CR5-6]